jgi:putative ABC transport system permease protein
VLATAIVHEQMDLVRAERLNVPAEEVLAVANRGKALDGGRYQTLRDRLLADPAVARVTTGPMPGRVNLRLGTDLDTTGQFDQLGALVVGAEYPETLGLEIVAGQSFTEAATTRSDMQGVALINETAARLAGYTADSLGQPGSPFNRATVVGIVVDFHAASLFEPIMPVMLLGGNPEMPNLSDQVLVRLRANATADGLAAVQAAWSDLVPDRPLDYAFLDDELDARYREELRLGQLFGLFAGLALVIACLGLLGLSAYVAQRRAKEISIRKVLGATAGQVVRLLSAEFVALVAVAFAVGAPVAYLAMERWLADFAYRVDLGPGLFAAAGMAVLALTVLTVSAHALRAARSDPASVLRTE